MSSRATIGESNEPNYRHAPDRSSVGPSLLVRRQHRLGVNASTLNFAPTSEPPPYYTARGCLNARAKRRSIRVLLQIGTQDPGFDLSMVDPILFGCGKARRFRKLRVIHRDTSYSSPRMHREQPNANTPNPVLPHKRSGMRLHSVTFISVREPLAGGDPQTNGAFAVLWKI